MASQAIRTVLLTLLLAGLCQPVQAWYSDGYSYRRALPNAIDLMETGLYWMQDWSGPEDASDPASLIQLSEQQMGRYFDLGHMALQVAGPWYANRNIMARAHAQNRLRDHLFTELARQFGLFSYRLPRIWPLPPQRIGMGSVLVGSRVWQAGRPAANIYFHLSWTVKGWRVYDVSKNGYSIITHLQQRFRDGQLPL